MTIALWSLLVAIFMPWVLTILLKRRQQSRVNMTTDLRAFLSINCKGLVSVPIGLNKTALKYCLVTLQRCWLHIWLEPIKQPSIG